MGMLKGSIKNEILAIKIAEIGAQGKSAVFSVLSRDEKGEFSTCSGSYSYILDDGTIVQGDVHNVDLEKAMPVIKETGVVQLYSMVRGNFFTKDKTWLHLDIGFGHHLFVIGTIAEKFLNICKEQITSLIGCSEGYLFETAKQAAQTNE